MKILFYATLIGSIGSAAQATECTRTAARFFCAGDPVVTTYYYSPGDRGRVEGVSSEGVLVTFDTGHRGLKKQEDLGLRMGCIDLYCVGDTVYLGDRVIGVNPLMGTVIAASTVSGNPTVDKIENVSLAVGCVKGVCVHDEINAAGTVLSLNEFTESVSYIKKFQAIGKTKIKQALLSVKQPNFSDGKRALRRYPVLDTSLYLIPELRFSLRRPVTDYTH